MTQEKMAIELDRDEAIAVSEALAASGDATAEKVGLVIRNELGVVPLASTFYFGDDSDNEYRLYREGDNAPVAQLRVEDGSFVTAVDCADLDYSTPIAVIFETLVTLLLGADYDND